MFLGMSDRTGTYKVGVWRNNGQDSGQTFTTVHVKSITVDESTVVRDIDDLRIGRIESPDLEL